MAAEGKGGTKAQQNPKNVNSLEVIREAKETDTRPRSRDPGAQVTETGDRKRPLVGFRVTPGIETADDYRREETGSKSWMIYKPHYIRKQDTTGATWVQGGTLREKGKEPTGEPKMLFRSSPTPH